MSLAQAVPVDGNLYMIGWDRNTNETGVRVWMNSDFDTSTDSEYIVDAAASSSWDHVFGKIGSVWYAVNAPYIGGAVDKQYISMYTSTSLSGPWTNQQVSFPADKRWDYWPDLYTENNAGYLFYNSEDDGHGHITMITLP